MPIANKHQVGSAIIKWKNHDYASIEEIGVLDRGAYEAVKAMVESPMLMDSFVDFYLAELELVNKAGYSGYIPMSLLFSKKKHPTPTLCGKRIHNCSDSRGGNNYVDGFRSTHDK